MICWVAGGDACGPSIQLVLAAWCVLHRIQATQFLTKWLKRKGVGGQIVFTDLLAEVLAPV